MDFSDNGLITYISILLNTINYHTLIKISFSFRFKSTSVSNKLLKSDTVLKVWIL